MSLLRSLTLAVAIAATTATTACGPQVPARVPAGPSVTMVAEDTGWIRVREPGWMNVQFPAAPAVRAVPDRFARGAFEFRQLRLQAQSGLFVVNYVEFVERKDAEDALALVRDRFARSPPSGVHPTATSEVTIDGRKAYAFDAVADPNSETNGAATPVFTRARALLDGSRMYFLQHSAPGTTPTADGDAFLGSFHLEGKASS